MNLIDVYLLKSNLFSWFLSKYIPIVFILIVSVVVAFKMKKNKIKNTILKGAVMLGISIIPVSSYLFFNPIYSGDIFKSGAQTKTRIEFPKEKVLSIFVLPDCPFCHETINIAQLLAERNPTISIRFLITGTQSDKAFKRIKLNQIIVSQNNEIDQTIYLTKGVFPTFVISENHKVVKRWTNNEFGVLALDEMEAFFNN